MKFIISECIEASKAKTGSVLLKKLFLKISQIQEKTPMLDCFLIKTSPLSLQLSRKETATHAFFCEYCESFNNTYFEEHLRMAAFESFSFYVSKQHNKLYRK